MNQHFRAVPGIPNPRSPLAPYKNAANYELARDENVLVSVPRELLKPLGQFGAKDGQHPSASGPARGCWGQSWENTELGAPRAEPGGFRIWGATRAPLPSTRDPCMRHVGISSIPRMSIPNRV